MMSDLAKAFYKRYEANERRRSKRLAMTKYHDDLKRLIERLRDDGEFYAALQLLKSVSHPGDFEEVMKKRLVIGDAAGEAADLEQIQACWATSMPKISLAMLVFFSDVLFGQQGDAVAPLFIMEG